MIGDRGIDSICVYQGWRAAHPSSFEPVTCLTALESLYRSLSLPLPELTILLTLPEMELARRFEARNRRRALPAELKELMKIQEGLLSISSECGRFATINADMPKAEVERLALELIRDRVLEA